MESLELCPTCQRPYTWVRCKVTTYPKGVAFTQCLSCGVLQERGDKPIVPEAVVGDDGN